MFRVMKIEDPRPWKDVIMLALTDINQRSGGDYLPAQLYDYMTSRQLPDPSWFGLWLCMDQKLFKSGVGPEDAVCGMTTMTLTPDSIGNPVANIVCGWVRKGYKGEPFDAFLPIAREWAKERRCTSIATHCERSSVGANDFRLSMKGIVSRLRGLAAYAKWVGKRDFVMRETEFRLMLI